jgi:Holliday junction resolvase RusA-like endonuclease
MISFTIPGTPVPQGRPRLTSTGHAYYDKKTKEYRERVRQCAIVAQEGAEPLTGALAMFVDCVMPIPESWAKHRKQAALHGMWHTSTKDTDNLIKAVADSCNGIIYEDDSQLALVVGTKSYGTEPEAKVTIYQLNDLNNPRWLISNLKRTLAGCEI